MARVPVRRWEEGSRALRILLEECLGGLGFDAERIGVVVSCSSSAAYARVWGLPRVFQEAFNLQPLYVIEFVYPRASRLSPSKRLDVLLHELAHIPRGFTGGLRGHGEAFQRAYRRLSRAIRECSARHKVETLLSMMPDPCRGKHDHLDTSL